MMKKTKKLDQKLRLDREALRRLDLAKAKIEGGMMCSLGHTGCGSCCDMGSCVTNNG